jgi:hypothetical protein
MRRDFFSASVARPPVQQLAARMPPVLLPVSWCPAHAPAQRWQALNNNNKSKSTS